jgi:hypothetical protein
MISGFGGSPHTAEIRHLYLRHDFHCLRALQSLAAPPKNVPMAVLHLRRSSLRKCNKVLQKWRKTAPLHKTQRPGAPNPPKNRGGVLHVHLAEKGGIGAQKFAGLTGSPLWPLRVEGGANAGLAIAHAGQAPYAWMRSSCSAAE